MNQIDSGLALATDRPLSVLFVGDEFSRCVDHVTAAVARGWRAHVVSSLDAALAAAESNPPDVIVTSVDPGGPVDGFELARRIKSGVSTHHLPVVALTDSPMDDALDAARGARCSGVVARSCGVEALIAAVMGAAVVADILARRRAARAMGGAVSRLRRPGQLAPEVDAGA